MEVTAIERRCCFHLFCEIGTKWFGLHSADVGVNVGINGIVVHVGKEREPMIKDRAQPECSGLFVADDCNIIGVSVFVEQEGIQFHDRAEISSKILKPRNFFNEVDRILDLRFDSPHLSYGLGKPYTLISTMQPLERDQRL